MMKRSSNVWGRKTKAERPKRSKDPKKLAVHDVLRRDGPRREFHNCAAKKEVGGWGRDRENLKKGGHSLLAQDLAEKKKRRKATNKRKTDQKGGGKEETERKTQRREKN